MPHHLMYRRREPGSLNDWMHYARYSDADVDFARHEYRGMAERHPTLKFILVISESSSKPEVPQENPMPWNCALCQTERPAAEEPLEILNDRTRTILAVCGPCFRNTTSRCACCRVSLAEPQRPNNDVEQPGFICHECTDHHFECRACHTQRNTDQRQSMPNGTSACRTCYERLYAQCRDCGDRFERGEVTDGACSRCRRGRVIRQHSYKPTPSFFGSGPRFFGVELEVECGRTEPADVAEEVVNEIGSGFVYAKHDGSLDHGFEVVSHPFSDDWFSTDGEKMWTKILKALKRHGCRSYETETCGMHVHVSRNAFTPTQLLRLQRLSHNNPDLILQLSRRKRENLQRWANPADSDLREQHQLAVGRLAHKRNRYAAINVTGKTVEIRIFRGTCDIEGFFGNLEAVRSLVDYSALATGLFPRARDYYAFIKQNGAKYPNLIATVLKDAVPA